MGTTAWQVNSESTTIASDHTRVEELTKTIANHSARFRRIAMAHLGDAADAEDAVQDAVLAALKHVSQFRGQAKMSTWLTAIVINSARMKLRQRFGRVHLSLDQANGYDVTLAEVLSDARPGPEEAYCNQEVGRRFEHALSQLSPILRETFQLRFIRGLSIRETAHHLGVPSGTVKARLARARARLTQLINSSSAKPWRRVSVASRQRLQGRTSLALRLTNGFEHVAVFQ